MDYFGDLIAFVVMVDLRNPISTTELEKATNNRYLGVYRWL